MMEMKIVDGNLKPGLAIRMNAPGKIAQLSPEDIFRDFNDNARRLESQLFDDGNGRVFALARKNPFWLDVKKQLSGVADLDGILQCLPADMAIHHDLL